MHVTWYIAAPAYGRDYHTKAEALAAWAAGSDFRNLTYGVPGAYLSVRDIPDGARVQIRYRNLTQVAVA